MKDDGKGLVRVAFFSPIFSASRKFYLVYKGFHYGEEKKKITFRKLITFLTEKIREKFFVGSRVYLYFFSRLTKRDAEGGDGTQEGREVVKREREER